MATFVTHPMREAVKRILEKHFSSRIAKRFYMEFEANIYDRMQNENIFNQVRDNQLILEIRYKESEENYVYICDVHAWWTRKQAEYHILRYITDKVKEGKIGKDWTEKDFGGSSLTN